MDATFDVDVDAIRTHLTLMYESGIDYHGLYFCIFTLPNKTAKFFNEIEPAVDWCANQARNKQHVYCGMGMFERPILDGRGSANDVKAIAGFWSDIDVLDSGAHKGKDYPHSVEEALSIIDVGGNSPTFYVLSGYGIHAYWLFKEPLVFDNQDQRNDASVLLARWHGTIQANAKSRGKVVDSVHDLARVLRVAGTVNYKQNMAKPVVLVKPQHSRNYLMDDLEPYLIATEYVKSGAEMVGEVANFVINPNINISSMIIQTFCANNNELADTWNMKRPDFKDQSASTYEMSLANWFVKIGYDDQSIVDLLVFWRRTVAKNPKNRVDYYQRTIGKCRASQQAEQAIKMFDQPGEMPSTSDPTLLTQNDRQKLLNAVRGALTINVARFVQLNKDNAEYFLVLDNGDEFSLGRVANITRFHTFRDRVLERCNILIPGDRQERWGKVVQALFAIVERRDSDEPRHQDRAFSLMTDYLEHVKIYQEEEWEQALAEDYPMVRHGKVWINKRHFIRWCQTNRGIRFSESDVERDFHLLRMERERHEGILKGRTRRPWFWGLPLDDFTSIMTESRKPKRTPDK